MVHVPLPDEQMNLSGLDEALYLRLPTLVHARRARSLSREGTPELSLNRSGAFDLIWAARFATKRILVGSQKGMRDVWLSIVGRGVARDQTAP